jgi:hypothetical protein
MDYWCALWFWDMRQATELPNREQYWQDIANILDLDLGKAAKELKKSPVIYGGKTEGVQLNFFGPTVVQQSLPFADDMPDDEEDAETFSEVD